MENSNPENGQNNELDNISGENNDKVSDDGIIAGTPEAKKALLDKNKKKKKPKSKKRRITEIVLIIIGIILLLVIIAAAAIIIPLYVSYRNSYVGDKIPIETRDSEYVIPQVPDDIVFDSSAETDDINNDTNNNDDSNNNNNSEPDTPPQGNSNYINPDSYEYNGISGIYTNIPIYYKEQINKDVENILVIGTDSRNSSVDRGRSDAMIVVSYNKSAGTVKLVSLLRDSLVPVEGYGWTRLNHAYAYGGVGLCINTINTTYGLDIQKFVVIDFQGVEKLIDKAGGITLNLTAEEVEYLNVGLTPGNNLIYGSVALKHCRNRTVGSDFQRTERQRDVIMALYNHIMSDKNPAEIYDIVNFGITITKTNISTSDLMALTTSTIKNPPSSFESLSLPFSDAYRGGYYNGMSILFFDLPSTSSRLRDILYN